MGQAGARPSGGEGLPHVCIAEDRVSCEPGVRLLVASLFRFAPKARAHIFYPNAGMDFLAWVARFPLARVNQIPLSREWRGYDIKPSAFLAMLDAGVDDILWIDSDIILAGDPTPALGGLDPGTLAVAEEALIVGASDNGMRARRWGFQPGRTLRYATNTGVVRMTREHRRLMERWAELLDSETYRAAQAQSWAERPAHMMSDQDVFTALITSAEFADIPVKTLRRGFDIVQLFGMHGYTTAERVRSLARGLPPFIHSQGFKPFWPRQEACSAGQKLTALYNELSCYTMAARRYRAELTDAAWLEPPTALTRALTAAALGRAALVGLPLAMGADLARWARRLSGRWEQPDSAEAAPPAASSPLPG